MPWWKALFTLRVLSHLNHFQNRFVPNQFAYFLLGHFQDKAGQRTHPFRAFLSLVCASHSLHCWGASWQQLQQQQRCWTLDTAIHIKVQGRTASVDMRSFDAVAGPAHIKAICSGCWVSCITANEPLKWNCAKGETPLVSKVYNQSDPKCLYHTSYSQRKLLYPSQESKTGRYPG